MGRRGNIGPFLGGSAFGILAFCIIYGVKILDVRYDAWLLTGGDLTQHYLGWCLYRSSPWTFPIGLTSEFAWPYEISVMYADVIPVCAVFFKLLSPLLPDTFQYFGIWGLLCYALQGGLASVLLHRFIPQVWLGSMLSLFFIVGYQIMYRMFGHTAFGAQWILLLSLIFLFNRDLFGSKRAWRIALGATGALCVFVHGYFVPMVFFIMLTALYMHWWKAGEKKECFLLIGAYAFSVIASMWILGAFSLHVAANATDYGTYGANLDAFFNPILPTMSRFMPSYHISPGQLDGYAYLGLGGIILVLAAFLRICWEKIRGKQVCGAYAPMLLLWFGCMLMAVFQNVAFHDTIVFHVHYPDWMTRVLSIFRGNGRFIWIPTYLLLLLAIVKTAGMQGKILGLKIGSIMVCLMLMLQMVDFSTQVRNLHRNIYDGIGRYYQAALDGKETHPTGKGRELLDDYDVIDDLMKKYDYVAYTDYNYVYKTDHSLMISWYEYKNKVKMNAFYLARMPDSQLQAEQKVLVNELKAGRPREDTLYVIADRDAARQYEGRSFYEVNGLLLGSKK